MKIELLFSQVPTVTLSCSSEPREHCANVCKNVYWCKVGAGGMTGFFFLKIDLSFCFRFAQVQFRMSAL